MHHERRQAERRLVAEQQPGPGHERPADGEHLLLAARERARELAAPLAEHREAIIRRLHAGREAAPEIAAARQGVAAQLQVVEHGEVAEDPAPLRHQRDPRPEQRLRRLPGDVAPVDRDAARGGREQPGDRPEQRGLARPVGADQGHQLARADLQGDVAQRVHRRRSARRARSPQATAATSSPR